MWNLKQILHKNNRGINLTDDAGRGKREIQRACRNRKHVSCLSVYKNIVGAMLAQFACNVVTTDRRVLEKLQTKRDVPEHRFHIPGMFTTQARDFSETQ